MCECETEVLFCHCKDKIGVKVCIEMKDVIQIAIINSTVNTVIQEYINLAVIIQDEMLFLHFNEINL